MHPLICTIGPLAIYSYGLMLALAFLVASALAAIQARKENLNPELIFNFCFAILISGIIGARIFYVTENIGYYIHHPLEIIMLQHGGLSWFGGFIAALIYAAIYLKKKKLNVYRTLDLIAPFLALGQAIGRIGCLFNGCCFGRTIIPIQIYSSLALVLIFIILRILQDRPHRTGEVFFYYLLFYSIKRFLVEFWRTDNPVVFLHLTLFQIISIALLVFAAIKLMRLSRNKI